MQPISHSLQIKRDRLITYIRYQLKCLVRHRIDYRAAQAKGLPYYYRTVPLLFFPQSAVYIAPQTQVGL